MKNVETSAGKRSGFYTYKWLIMFWNLEKQENNDIK